jgi:sulfatase maturation enzyme AslB (radical SAM superfamily)
MSDNTEVFMMSDDNSYMFDKESNPDDQYKNLPLDKIRRANFLGGEPLLNQEVYDVMSHWIDIGKNDVRISITTNGTSFTNKWMELFSKFKKINLLISLDGVEDVFEYIRTNANWKKVIENCKKIEQLETVSISFSYCIQMYNAFDLTNILNFIKHWNLSNDIIFERVHQNFLCTTLLTEKDYNKIISDLNIYKKLDCNSSKWVDEIINILKYDRTRIITEAERTYFKDYTNSIDQARNTKLTNLSPEFKKYLI